jgi:hypothetical protein
MGDGIIPRMVVRPCDLGAFRSAVRHFLLEGLPGGLVAYETFLVRLHLGGYNETGFALRNFRSATLMSAHKSPLASVSPSPLQEVTVENDHDEISF